MATKKVFMDLKLTLEIPDDFSQTFQVSLEDADFYNISPNGDIVSLDVKVKPKGAGGDGDSEKPKGAGGGDDPEKPKGAGGDGDSEKPKGAGGDGDSEKPKGAGKAGDTDIKIIINATGQ
jgi:hypothetical protein